MIYENPQHGIIKNKVTKHEIRRQGKSSIAAWYMCWRSRWADRGCLWGKRAIIGLAPLTAFGAKGLAHDAQGK